MPYLAEPGAYEHPPNIIIVLDFSTGLTHVLDPKCDVSTIDVEEYLCDEGFHIDSIHYMTTL